MLTIRTLIVDDEPLARRRLRRLLPAGAGLEVVGECGDGATAIDMIAREAPDLLFLDVQMPEIDGFGVLEGLPAERRPVVIFVTAYDAYAVRAFEVHALDYLLKPIDPERLARAVQRAEEQVRLRRDHVPGQAEAIAALLDEVRARRGYAEYVLVRDAGRVIPVRVEAIEWVQAAGKYVRLHAGAKTFLLREGIDRLEAKLDPARFLRIHRSTLVNARCVEHLEPAFHGDYALFLRDGTRLTLSRSHRARFHRLFGGEL